MTDLERIELVERYRLDVWYHDRLDCPGWVADRGDVDESLWSTDAGADGGSALTIGQPSWRAAVDQAAEMLTALGVAPGGPNG